MVKKRTPSPDNRRLGAVASLVPQGSRVADVGTDRGLLPRLLLATGRASHCIGTEIGGPAGRGPFDPAGRGRHRERLEFRAGFGLRVLAEADRIDVLVLSGLGARTIVRILEDRAPAELGIKRLVLQPQSEPGTVRRWLFAHDFAIVAERMALERGRYYVAMGAEPGGSQPGPDHPRLDRAAIEEAGPCLLRSGDPLVREYWERVLHEQRQILERAQGGTGREAAERLSRIARDVLADLL